MPPTTSLNSRRHPLIDPKEQQRLLQNVAITKRFQQTLQDAGCARLRPLPLEVLQVNLGKLCNMSCAHCHVDAGPDRTEVMNDTVLDKVLDLFQEHPITTLDVTGGAPELHPRFREIMQRAASLPNRRVLHRCNLTAIMTRRFQDVPKLLADLGVEIIASLPCYTEALTDQQRGEGTFTKSIRAIKRLNQLGYGVEGSGLTLNLVHNPVGASLPGDQFSLEAAYKRQFAQEYGIVFNQLFALTNQPISRFLDFLYSTQQLDTYMNLLVNAFNPHTLSGLMCRNTLSVSWDGFLYDCDFNQMLDLKINTPSRQHLFDWDATQLENRTIATGEHCYACTAGSGSSCGGQLAEDQIPMVEAN